MLEELARVTRGKVVGPEEVDDVVRALADLPEAPPSVRRVQLWSHPGTLAGLVALLGSFWVGRKAVGLV